MMGQLAYDYGGVDRFLADRCRPNNVAYVRGRDLYLAYRTWCTDMRMPDYLILTETGFGVATTQGRVLKRRTADGVRYLGIELVEVEATEGAGVGPASREVGA
jgi:hypothetical protein